MYHKNILCIIKKKKIIFLLYKLYYKNNKNSEINFTNFNNDKFKLNSIFFPIVKHGTSILQTSTIKFWSINRFQINSFINNSVILTICNNTI